MTPPLIHAALAKLRRAADHPEARRLLTESDRTLIALADLVDQMTAAIDGHVRCEMTGQAARLLADLRAAVPRKATPS
jgi:hypothetical protein